VRLPGVADKDVAPRRAARWTLSVDNNAQARLRFVPAERDAADPRWIAGIAATLLTGTYTTDGPSDDGPGRSAGDRARDGDGDSAGDGGIMRAVGLELRRRGR
jgi:hypothetical protein